MLVLRDLTCNMVVQIIGFVPTGWMYEMKRTTFPVRQKAACKIHLVPYSEHSSYSELKEYVRFLRPAQARLYPGILDSGLLDSAWITVSYSM